MKRILLLSVLAMLYIPAAMGQYTRWDGYLTNAQGQAIQGAQVYILVQPATVSAFTPQAPVYSSVTGGALTQPLRTDGFGHVYAYVTETVNAAACSTLGSLCYTIVYISKSTGQVVLPDQVVGGGGGGTPPAGDCLPTTGGGPYPTANGQGEVMSLTNDGTGCASSMDLTTSLGSGPDGTLWFHQNWNIEMDSDVDPSGEQTLIQPTFWRMLSSTGNGGPAQVELQIDDSAGVGGGIPLLIEAQAVKDSPASGWIGIDIQPSIGGADKAHDMSSILVESLAGHGARFRKYRGLDIEMATTSATTEETAIYIQRPLSPVSSYCDFIADDGAAVRMLLGCGPTHTSTFPGVVTVPELDVNGTGAGIMQAQEGASCPTPTSGYDILCALTGSGMQLSNNGVAYFTIGAGGGGSAFSAITGSTNTTAAMVVGTGASIAPTGSGTIQATNIASTIAAGTNVTITGAGTVASPYSIASSGGGGGGGAMTLISDQVLGAPAATVTFAAISGSYKTLKLFIQGRCSQVTTAADVIMQANGDTGNNYDRQYLLATGGGSSAGQVLAQAGASFTLPCASASANEAGAQEATITNYASTTFNKAGFISGQSYGGAGLNDLYMFTASWHWRNTAAITQLVLTMSGGSNFITGSRFTLYGIN